MFLATWCVTLISFITVATVPRLFYEFKYEFTDGDNKYKMLYFIIFWSLLADIIADSILLYFQARMSMIERDVLETMSEDLWRANLVTSGAEIFLSFIEILIFALSKPKWND